jgi:hypothetical protein
MDWQSFTLSFFHSEKFVRKASVGHHRSLQVVGHVHSCSRTIVPSLIHALTNPCSHQIMFPSNHARQSMLVNPCSTIHASLAVSVIFDHQSVTKTIA